ncbi:hypothetical protein [Halalkalibacter alkalisediminis]|uniref:Uncharacterized protein n=1 Tax=Halalkalibacter alkalisediminis TaxID=935616 RepID=A0ABV6NCJ8_9BACI|nr:hypothetical protein [Halalkalibacter alkalisediminis]
MVSFRGDAHKFYLKLKKEAAKGLNSEKLREIQELKEIKNFYETIDTSTLENIHH